MASLIIIFIVFIIIIAILFKLFKFTIKLLISSIIFLLLIISLISFLAYLDIKNIQKNLLIEDNLFLLKDQELLTGIIINTNNNLKQPLTEQELININPEKNNYYKTFLFNIIYLNKTLQNNIIIKTDPIKSEVLSLTKEQYLSLLKSNNPLEEFNLYTNNKYNITGLDKYKFKSDLFLYSFQEKLSISSILLGYKQKTISIYPKSTALIIIKFIPTPILKNIQ